MVVNQPISHAVIQIWGKGFRVSEDTEEFQRCVPMVEDSLSPMETGLNVIRWGSLLEHLYGSSERDLAGQFCILFGANEIMSISVAANTDKHRRPSLVLVAAAVGINWYHQEPERFLPLLTALTQRLAAAYSKAFDGNPAQVQKQLKENTFLPTRTFDLSDEVPDSRQDWQKVIRAVRRWKGINGIATPRLAGLGANVVIGTRHESERAINQHFIDGYMDVRTCEIHPISAAISLWQAEAVSNQNDEFVEVQHSHSAEIQELKSSVVRIEDRLDLLVEMTKRIMAIVEKAQNRRHK